MRPHLNFSAYTITFLTALGLGIVGNASIVQGQSLHHNYAQKTTEINSKQSEVKRLNDEALKLSQLRAFPDALKKLNQALMISKEAKYPVGEAGTLNNIARVYENRGDSGQALRYFQQALVIYRSINDRVGQGRTYSNIGHLFEKQNKPELAIIFYKLCANNREKVRLDPPKTPPPHLTNSFSLKVSETYRSLGKLLASQGRIAEAGRIMDLVKVQEVEEYIVGVKGNERTAKGVEMTPIEAKIRDTLVDNLDSAVSLGKELTTLRDIPPEKRTPDQKKRIEQIVKNQQVLLDNFNTFIASPEVTAQIAQLSRTARGQNLNLETINGLRDELKRLPGKPVIVYPFVLDNTLAVILVTPDSPPILRQVNVSHSTLNQTITAFRQALENPSRNVKKPAQELYEWIIKPIENDLKQAGAQTLLYAPDEQLRYIPLAALNDGKEWLVQRYTINHITAASLTNFNAPRPEKVKVFAGAFTKGQYKVRIGNRDVPYAGLPFAGKEVENLAATIPGTTKLLDNAFSRDVTIPQLDDYTVVHFATHAAFVVGKPEDSFILFGNGQKATFRDVASWSLPNVDLVVLSACETGLGGKLGNGDEILGFGYQIQKTGAKAAIASLWTVDDGGTQVLMNAFYRAFTSGKFNKAQSLREAQVAIITGDFSRLAKQARGSQSPQLGGSISHPYYWAPFILIGNGL
jgi:CHAT domain-containing protein